MLTLEIVLQSSAGYLPGDTVQGKLHCVVHEEIRIKKALIKIECIEHTYYKGKEFRHVTPITGNYLINSVLGSVKMESGEHSIPFSIDLPHSLPSTFTDDNGSIRYKLEVVLRIEDHGKVKCLTHINVLSPMVLECLHDIQEILTKRVDIDLGLIGTISMELTVPKGYLLGDEVDVNVKIFNNTFVSIKTVSARLVQEIGYSLSVVQDNMKFSKRMVLCTAKPRVFAGIAPRKALDIPMKMKIPSDIKLPNFASSLLFSSDYLIVAECQAPWIKEEVIAFIDNLSVGHLNQFQAVQRPSTLPDSSTSSQNAIPTSEGSPGAPVIDNIGFGAISKNAPVVSNAPLGFRLMPVPAATAPTSHIGVPRTLRSLLFSGSQDSGSLDSIHEDGSVNVGNLGFGAIYRNSPPVSSNTVSSAGSGSVSHIPELSRDDEGTHTDITSPPSYEQALRMSLRSSRGESVEY